MKAIPDDQLQRWYASVMLNRLIFVYFIQQKGFLNGDTSSGRRELHCAEARKVRAQEGRGVAIEAALTARPSAASLAWRCRPLGVGQPRAWANGPGDYGAAAGAITWRTLGSD